MKFSNNVSNICSDCNCGRSFRIASLKQSSHAQYRIKFMVSAAVIDNTHKILNIILFANSNFEVVFERSPTFDHDYFSYFINFSSLTIIRLINGSILLCFSSISLISNKKFFL